MFVHDDEVNEVSQRRHQLKLTPTTLDVAATSAPLLA